MVKTVQLEANPFSAAEREAASGPFPAKAPSRTRRPRARKTAWQDVSPAARVSAAPDGGRRERGAPSPHKHHQAAKKDDREEALADETGEDQGGGSSLLVEKRQASARRESGERLWHYRCFWDEQETSYLKEGVKKYGKGKWKAMLSDPSFCFKDRSSVDLKDKWRNMEMFVSWSDHEMRRYILLDASHVPVRTPSDGYHIYQNRWPRDAALKVASRDEFYPGGPDDASPFWIYLREVRGPPGGPSSSGDPGETAGSAEDLVHVYRGSRDRRVAADIEKFHNRRFMWVPMVAKVRTEKLSFGRTAILKPLSI